MASITAAERPSPSIWAVAFASALVAGITGYFLGQASSIGIFASNGPPHKQPQGEPDESAESEESEDEHDSTSQELNSFADANEECKLVLVVRTDLGMTKGTRSPTCLRAF